MLVTLKKAIKSNIPSVELEYLIKLTDLNTGSLVWSNSFWYSGLEMQRTIELCLKNLVSQIDKLLNKASLNQ